ncbi:tRNA cyclic N6-threonylcarbamoyladenosine(37) synthase TcdA [Celerinatantimonas diazotrophica]|uniref:tRNA threonylcarbamoyladenosine dehydratase n=1 Tax=Celerinatantimonas diazotrophica TaxID=412034 RepID=A0A4V2PNE5_9GAMM|nr:tRNA cyclic N6-threonylcarbamoyladenosine(37) synthase TcdA [Celerinatantimonas diazotrophica]TCK46701.1 tRNA A37 threonylcarbamoyladenosine dehydratase [Celerinatantimonas diazotrophica]CAG9295403.1 tRNA threonylcarbamoyladenosine dehydratase [Celerinatantimonas diazotrophica]
MSYQQRFGGIARLYGNRALEQFQASHVCVIGIGGVGSWAAEALARSGIGQITLVDLDDVCVTNTNRQLHTLTTTIGQPKTDVIQARILQINPEAKCAIIDDFITADNVSEYIDNRFDYVIDAIDSVKAKTALLAHCKRNKIKVITVGGAGGQIDPTQIKVADLAKTIQDPLASKVRSELRRRYNFSKNPKRKFGIECVFSTEQLIYPDNNGEICSTKNTDGSMRMNCSGGFGAATHVTASFGMIAAGQVLKKLAMQSVPNRSSDSEKSE